MLNNGGWVYAYPLLLKILLSMFGKLKSLSEKIQNLDEDEVIDQLAKDENLKENIVHYNTQDQLYEKGIDSEGNSLGDYSPFTRGIKQEKGQRFDHITLKDTGAFYDSFKVVQRPEGLMVEADSNKGDKDLRVEFGNEIVGLTSESLNKVIQEVRVKTLLFLKRIINV